MKNSLYITIALIASTTLTTWANNLNQSRALSPAHPECFCVSKNVSRGDNTQDERGIVNSKKSYNSYNEINQLIIEHDYDVAMNAIEALPQPQVRDRQQLLHAMLSAWDSDSAVSMYATRIKKAADALIGGNRNMIYHGVNKRLAENPTCVFTPIHPVSEIPETPSWQLQMLYQLIARRKQPI